MLELGAGVGLLGLFLAKQREEVLDAIVVTEHDIFVERPGSEWQIERVG